MDIRDPDGLAAALGGIDIYLLDQVLRGRIRPGMRILDAGCGGGRNTAWLLSAGFEVFGVEPDPGALAAARAVAAERAPDLPEANFRVDRIQDAAFPAGGADVVLSIAVLHFARDDAEFRAILDASWRALSPGGTFFCRLASDIGLEGRFAPLGGRRFRLGDGTERYLVDRALLADLEADLGAERLDPLKTTVVEDLRCMTTWVLRKRPGG